MSSITEVIDGLIKLVQSIHSVCEQQTEVSKELCTAMRLLDERITTLEDEQ